MSFFTGTVGKQAAVQEEGDLDLYILSKEGVCIQNQTWRRPEPISRHPSSSGCCTQSSSEESSRPSLSLLLHCVPGALQRDRWLVLSVQVGGLRLREGL